MCIIIAKKSGLPAPSESILQTCFENNPDGAGFALHRPGRYAVQIKKGFMDFESLWTALQKVNITEADTVVYHFRIATSGQINQGCCHPFPISRKARDLFRLELECRQAFIHNGIIGRGEKNYSDTQLYVLHNLTRYRSIKKSIKRIAQETKGSRTAILLGNGALYPTGTWIEDGGYHYSNNTYKPLYRALWDMYDTPNTAYDAEACYYCGTELKSWGNERYCPACAASFALCDLCGEWHDSAAVQLREGMALCFDCCDELDTWDSDTHAGGVFGADYWQGGQKRQWLTHGM